MKTIRENSKSHFALAAASALVLAAVPVYYYAVHKKKRKTLERQWSFTSEGMRLGVFPPEVKAPDTIINAALYYDGEPPSVQALAEQVVTTLLEYDRFSKVPGLRGVLRESANPYTASDLIRTVEFTGGDEMLHSTIYSMLSDKLDQGRNDKPWWELVRLVGKGNQSVVLFRVHHCLGDGLSLVKAFDKCIQTKDGTPAQESKVTRALMNRGSYKMPSLSSLLGAFFHVVTLASSKFDDATAIFKKDLTYSGKRKVLLLPNVPLQYIKDCKKQSPFPTTINDILMCAISQAMHDYCLQQKDPLLMQKGSQVQCRALLPVSLPRPQSLLENKSTALQNAFCMVSADLSISGGDDLLSRLRAIHATTTVLKQSPRAAVQLWLQNNVVCHLPASFGRKTAHDIFRRHTLVFTNVPGPEQPGWVAGKQVTALQLFFLNVLPQVDLLTYAGTVHGNIIYDPEDWPHGESLAKLYAQALVSLGTECGVTQIPQILLDAVVL